MMSKCLYSIIQLINMYSYVIRTPIRFTKQKKLPCGYWTDFADYVLLGGAKAS